MLRLRPGLIALLLAAAPAAADARLHRYTVAVDSDITEIRVRACFDGAPPPYLVAESLDASTALAQAQVEGGKRLEPNGAELKLGALAAGACIAYTSRVDRFQGRHQHGGGPTRRVGPDLIAEVGVWLWRPPALAQDEDIEVSFALPEGLSASAPWRPVRA